MAKARAAKAQKAKTRDEVAPSWALGLIAKLDQIGARVDALEKKPVSYQASSGLSPFPNPKGTAFYRCEDCNDIYEGPSPHKEGDPHKCEECRQPGRIMRQCCRCDKYMSSSRDYISQDVKCKKCQKCPKCGTGGRSDDVCKRCQQGTKDANGQWRGDGIKVCIHCNRQRDHTGVMCEWCLKAFSKESAGKHQVPERTFAEVDMASVPPDRVIASGAAQVGEYVPSGARMG